MFTDFGFKTVKDTDKQKLVQDLFQNVSSKYDVMNDVMSIGMHRFWKSHYIKHLPISMNAKILDLAAGTGDIALGIKQKYNVYNPHITLCDLTEGMLDKAKQRFIDQGILNNLEYICASAEELPFIDASFDGVTISFGLRNTTHKDIVLKEILRTLKPGGWVHILEFSKPTCDAFRKVYDFYSFNIIPKMGKVIADDEDAYQYLVESIKNFPGQEDLKNMMIETGFTNVSFENLTNGVVAIHKGFSPQI